MTATRTTARTRARAKTPSRLRNAEIGHIVGLEVGLMHGRRGTTPPGIRLDWTAARDGDRLTTTVNGERCTITRTPAGRWRPRVGGKPVGPAQGYANVATAKNAVRRRLARGAGGGATRGRGDSSN